MSQAGSDLAHGVNKTRFARHDIPCMRKITAKGYPKLKAGFARLKTEAWKKHNAILINCGPSENKKEGTRMPRRGAPGHPFPFLV